MNGGESSGFRRRRRGQRTGGSPQVLDPGAAESACPGAGLSEHKRLLIETALLIALIEESGHGYALIERVQQLVGAQLYADSGSVYRVLRLLEGAGMVSSCWEAGSAGPRRRRYAVEPSGCELLHSRARALEDRGNALLALSSLARERLK